MPKRKKKRKNRGPRASTVSCSMPVYTVNGKPLNEVVKPRKLTYEDAGGDRW